MSRSTALTNGVSTSRYDETAAKKHLRPVILEPLIAVKVDDSVGRAGLVYPGAIVDVIATIRDPEGRGPSTRIAVSAYRTWTSRSTARPGKAVVRIS